MCYSELKNRARSPYENTVYKFSYSKRVQVVEANISLRSLEDGDQIKRLEKVEALEFIANQSQEKLFSDARNLEFEKCPLVKRNLSP